MSIRDDIQEIKTQQMLLGKKLDTLNASVAEALKQSAVAKVEYTAQHASLSGHIKIIWAVLISAFAAVSAAFFKQ